MKIKLILKKILAVITDINILIFYSIAFWDWANNASGLLFSRLFFSEREPAKNLLYFIIPFLILSIAYYSASYLYKKQTLGNIIFNSRDGKKQLFISISALFIDISFVIIFSIITEFLIRNYIYIDFFNLFFIILFLYCFIASLIHGKTIGKYYFGIQIIDKRGNKIGKTALLMRENVFKYTFLIFLPYLLLHLLGITGSFQIFLNILVFGSFISILYYIVKKELWWSTLSHTCKKQTPLSKKKLGISYFLIVLFTGFSFLFVRHQNNSSLNSKKNFLGFHYSHEFHDYPNSGKVSKYSDFLKKQNLSAKEYILSLFERYDIVILHETVHGESTQWDMIQDIVSDKYFIENVGHIFTEYGSAKHQNKADTFLNTKFENDTLLEKATSSLMIYNSGGFYYFMKNLNKLNNNLPDSLKITEHYTDNIDWEYLLNENRWAIQQNRDSFMAQVTIDWYKNLLPGEKRRKCLVVTNYRHAFGYAGGVENVKNKYKISGITYGNQGQYIYEKIPDKTACVFQNSPINTSRRLLMFPVNKPIQNGIWDKAFLLNGNKSVGFDADKSPFGEDLFDIYPLKGAKINLKFQDIFTGIVFNKPFSQTQQKGVPYQRYAVEQEFLRKKEFIDSTEYLMYLSMFNSDKPTISNDWTTGFAISNFINILAFLFFSLLIIFITSKYFIKKIIV